MGAKRKKMSALGDQQSEDREESPGPTGPPSQSKRRKKSPHYDPVCVFIITRRNKTWEKKIDFNMTLSCILAVLYIFVCLDAYTNVYCIQIGCHNFYKLFKIL